MLWDKEKGAGGPDAGPGSSTNGVCDLRKVAPLSGPQSLHLRKLACVIPKGPFSSVRRWLGILPWSLADPPGADPQGRLGWIIDFELNLDQPKSKQRPGEPTGLMRRTAAASARARGGELWNQSRPQPIITIITAG